MLKNEKTPATAHRPPTACSPTLFSRLRCFVSAKRQTGIKISSISTGINRVQTGIECLIRAWSFPCSFLVFFFFWSIFLNLPSSFISHIYTTLFLYRSFITYTVSPGHFQSLCALCPAIAIVPRLVRGDLHSPPSPPLDCRLIPALRPRKFPRLIGTSHKLPGLHSSNPHCFKGNYLHSYSFFQSVFAFYWVACFALRTEATTSSNRPRAGSSHN